MIHLAFATPLRHGRIAGYQTTMFLFSLRNVLLLLQTTTLVGASATTSLFDFDVGVEIEEFLVAENGPTLNRRGGCAMVSVRRPSELPL